MAAINYAGIAANTTYSHTKLGWNAPTTIGVIGNAFDSNAGTSFAVTDTYTNGAYVRLTLRVAFTVPPNISKIKFIFNATKSTGSWDAVQSYYKLTTWADNTAFVVLENTTPWTPGSTLTKTFDGTWTKCDYVQIEMQALVAPAGNTTVNAIAYEIQAWGEEYQDIGLRLKTASGIINIGCDTVGTHPLRIRKGGTTYGIPLIATGGADDSGIRIYDGASIKTIPKL